MSIDENTEVTTELPWRDPALPPERRGADLL
jgi:hypothetical protein